MAEFAKIAWLRVLNSRMFIASYARTTDIVLGLQVLYKYIAEVDKWSFRLSSMTLTHEENDFFIHKSTSGLACKTSKPLVLWYQHILHTPFFGVSKRFPVLHRRKAAATATRCKGLSAWQFKDESISLQTHDGVWFDHFMPLYNSFVYAS